MSISKTYLPVDPDFYDTVEGIKSQGGEIKVFFFTENTELDSVNGKIEAVINHDKAEYLKLDNGAMVRLDRIITLKGRPGPLYDYYESFGNACLDCKVDY